MIKKVFELNKSDFALYTAVDVGVFLVWQLIATVIMLAVKPDNSAALGAIFVPVFGGFILLIGNSANCTVGFDLLLRFSVTRKKALAGTVVLLLAEALFTMGLGWLLGKADVAIAHAWLNLPYVDVVDIEFSFPLWGMALAAVVLTLLSLGVGAALQRFGRKAFWVLWAGWMLLVVFMNEIDWDRLFAMDATVPTLVIGSALLGIWGCWSFLHTAVKQ